MHRIREQPPAREALSLADFARLRPGPEFACKFRCRSGIRQHYRTRHKFRTVCLPHRKSGLHQRSNPLIYRPGQNGWQWFPWAPPRGTKTQIQPTRKKCHAPRLGATLGLPWATSHDVDEGDPQHRAEVLSGRRSDWHSTTVGAFVADVCPTPSSAGVIFLGGQQPRRCADFCTRHCRATWRCLAQRSRA